MKKCIYCFLLILAVCGGGGGDGSAKAETNLIFDWEGAVGTGSIGSLTIDNSSSTFPFNFDTSDVVSFHLSFSTAFDDFVFGTSFVGFSASGHIELTAGGTPELVDLNLIAPGVAGDGESVQLTMGFEGPAGSFLTVLSSIGGVLASHFGVWSFREPLTTVVIDIKPGSDANSINPTSKGKIPVAVLTAGAFDATQVDVSTVVFGPARASESHGRSHVEDVDGDGDMDLVLHFNTQDTGIQCGDTDASLTGEIWAGGPIMGTDAITTVNCP